VDVNHVLLALLLFEFLGTDLYLMGLLIVLLFGHLVLDLSQVEKFNGLLVFGGQGSLQVLTILFEILSVTFLKG